MDKPVLISVVVPVYAGQDYLPRLVEALAAVRASWESEGAPMRLGEAVLVDDEAIDRSAETLDALAKAYPWVVPLHLMRNFGQHAATIAGIQHTSGDWVVTMDEDLQHPPAAIETMLRKAVSESADIIYGTPDSDVHEALSRDWASRAFKQLMVRLSGNSNVRYFSSFRLIRGPLARAVSSVCGHDTYFDVALSWFTTRVATVPMTLKDERYISKGQSGYKLSRLLSHARRMLISSQVKVLRVCGLFGLAVVGLSILASIGLVLQHFLVPESILARGWTSLALMGLFFGGFITFMIGIALEYLSSLVLVAHGKPLYFVADRSSDSAIAAHFHRKTP
ncbi:MAG: glycosyltransferase family 2 protein [Phreatobacter sp.]|uniref:glycosyltransferase family 2 protein n=1 Tax=Phreatobacter sp. TaxID=1966341 RepID=UPI001A3BBA65|nr:glycosyltransferase family 2 protein [Phreatobacter sp.]MBL8569776.1 glycosyltransferase family 2 protein [Phreatobacter sp.]